MSDEDVDMSEASTHLASFRPTFRPCVRTKDDRVNEPRTRWQAREAEYVSAAKISWEDEQVDELGRSSYSILELREALQTLNTASRLSSARYACRLEFRRPHHELRG